ncbi:MAG: hypothetical protein ABL958_21240 [Bdellovibrionia bacterium]
MSKFIRLCAAVGFIGVVITAASTAQACGSVPCTSFYCKVPGAILWEPRDPIEWLALLISE